MHAIYISYLQLWHFEDSDSSNSPIPQNLVGGGGREKPDWCTQVFLQCLPTPEYPSQVKHVARPCWRQRKSHPALKQLRVWLADLSALVSCLHYFSSS